MALTLYFPSSLLPLPPFHSREANALAKLQTPHTFQESEKEEKKKGAPTPANGGRSTTWTWTCFSCHARAGFVQFRAGRAAAWAARLSA